MRRQRAGPCMSEIGLSAKNGRSRVPCPDNQECLFGTQHVVVFQIAVVFAEVGVAFAAGPLDVCSKMNPAPRPGKAQGTEWFGFC